MKRPKIYLAGPMRGYKDFNFPAFDRYRDWLEEQGISVISPADLDRAVGFNPKRSLASQQEVVSLEKCLKRDVNAICKVDAVMLMPKWEKSTGCNMELAVATFLQKPAYRLKKL